MRPELDAPPASMGPVAVLQSIVDRISLVSAYVAAGCLGGLTLLTLGQVALGVLSKVSHVFPSDIAAGWEYSAYLMGTAFMLGGALTLRAGMQIRVQIVMRSFGGRFERPLEILSSIIGAAFIEGIGINVLVSAEPGFPASGAAYHDTAVWLQRA